jgi:hypothetical protein
MFHSGVLSLWGKREDTMIAVINDEGGANSANHSADPQEVVGRLRHSPLENEWRVDRDVIGKTLEGPG